MLQYAPVLPADQIHTKAIFFTEICNVLAQPPVEILFLRGEITQNKGLGREHLIAEI